VPRVARGADRALDLGGAALVDVGEHVAALVRLDRFERLAGAHLLATDDQRDVEPLRLHVTESPLELLALRRSGRIAANRLVVRLGDAKDAVSAHGCDSMVRGSPSPRCGHPDWRSNSMSKGKLVAAAVTAAAIAGGSSAYALARGHPGHPGGPGAGRSRRTGTGVTARAPGSRTRTTARRSRGPPARRSPTS